MTASSVDRLARLQREAAVLASLNHPNIAAIYGLERASGLHYVSLDELSIMRAELRAGDAGFESDAPFAYAEIPVMSVARSPYDVAADGRLLLLERTINRGVPLALIANWRTMVAGR